jgi:hypothetical protein
VDLYANKSSSSDSNSNPDTISYNGIDLYALASCHSAASTPDGDSRKFFDSNAAS